MGQKNGGEEGGIYTFLSALNKQKCEYKQGKLNNNMWKAVLGTDLT